MKRTNNFTRRSVAALAVLITMMCGSATAYAQTSAFTYQGRLSDASAAANGSYDLGFALYDAETGGTQIGGAQTRAAVNVANGIFTVQLDFGAAAFPGANRFLEIAVKRPADTNFTTLAPRQPLTSAQINSIDGAKVTGNVPSATTAQNSGQLGGVDANNFVQSGSNAFVRNQSTAQTADFNITGTGSIGGKVDIGTTANTTEALRVVGSNGNTSNGTGGAGEGISLQAGSGGISIRGDGGAGASISLQAGNGGSAGNAGGAGADISLRAGSGAGAGNVGGGGSITLQPGGGQLSSGANGNVLLAPNSGNVGIGTTSPTSKLYVNGDLTVTGTINGIINAANVIRNQTTQQTGNFNISGNGTTGGNLNVGGDLYVNGTLNASLGQDATTQYGTGGLTVTRTSPNFTLVPELTKTIVVPANTFPEIIISTDGGIRSNSTTSDGRSVVEVAIYVDGAILSSRQYHLTNVSISPSVNNWALTISQLLTPGSHTVEVHARSTSESFLSNATVSGGDSVLRGLLTVMVIKR